MSVRIMSQIWDLDVSPTEKLVLLALADWSNDDGHCWPSIAQLAAKTGVGERTVQRAIRAAEIGGILTRDEIIGKGNKYRLHPRHSDTPATVTPVTNDAETPATVTPNTSVHTSRKKDKPSSSVRAKSDRIVKAWNEMAEGAGLPLVTKLTDERLRSLKARLREHSIDEIERAIEQVPRNPHWMGERGWQGNFTSFIRPGKITAFLEASTAPAVDHDDPDGKYWWKHDRAAGARG